MPTSQEAAEMRQALIQVQPEATEVVDQAIKAVEELGGRVLLSFPPCAIVASLASERLDELRSKPGIESVDTEEIAEDRLEAAPDTTRIAMMAWNEHLARQRTAQEPISKDLSWDAPGRLPPDPPPHIQEMLRRRERDMQSGADEQASS